MTEMLEMMDSSYHPAIKILIENVLDGTISKRKHSDEFIENQHSITGTFPSI